MSFKLSLNNNNLQITKKILIFSLAVVLLFTSCSPAKDSITTFDKKWDFKAQSWFLSAPAIGKDGTLYVGSWDGNLYAIDKNGKLKWKYKTEGHILFSPVIKDDGTIYLASELMFYSINSKGTLNWKINIDNRKFLSIFVTSPLLICSPLYKVDENTFSVNVLNTIPLTLFGGTIYEVDVKNKVSKGVEEENWSNLPFDVTLRYTKYRHNLHLREIWKLNTNGQREWSFKTPLPITYIKVLKNNVYVSSFNYLFKLNSDGKVVWKIKTSIPMTLITPLEDGTVYFVSFNNLYKVDRNGKVIWKFRTFLPITQLSISKNGDIYFASMSNLYRLNSLGQETSRFKASLPITSITPLSNGTVYVTSLDHSVYALYESP